MSFTPIHFFFQMRLFKRLHNLNLQKNLHFFKSTNNRKRKSLKQGDQDEMKNISKGKLKLKNGGY